MSNIVGGNSQVKLNVGGRYYITTISTLTKFPHSTLGVMFSDRTSVLPVDSNDGSVFIDRDGDIFKYILNFLRYPDQFNPYAIHGYNVKDLKFEADFYRISEQMFPIKPDRIHTVLCHRRDRIDVDREEIWSIKQNIKGIWEALPSNFSTNLRQWVPLNVCKSCDTAVPIMALPSYSTTNRGILHFTNHFVVLETQPHNVCQLCDTRVEVKPDEGGGCIIS